MKNILIILFLSLSMSCIAQNYSTLIQQADENYDAKNFRKSFSLYRQALQQQSTVPAHLYNGACTAALAGDQKQALEWLELAIDKGWTDITHLKSDSDLASLHQHKEWARLIAKLQKNVDAAEAKYDKPLKQELEALYDADQKIRHEYIEARKKFGFDHKIVDSLGREMNRIDSINHKKIVRILDSKGWVGSDVVGNKANQALFLVVQHADLEMQKKYLPIMREAVQKGNANASSLALLEDRIALREGRKQIYGSQVGRIPETTEHYVLPLQDPENVDERRATVGLGPLSEYLQNWELTWDVNEYKRKLPYYEEISSKKN